MKFSYDSFAELNISPGDDIPKALEYAWQQIMTDNEKRIVMRHLNGVKVVFEKEEDSTK